MEVTDLGVPRKKATTSALVIIKVVHNKNIPNIVNLPSTAPDLPQVAGVGTRVFTVEAKDLDKVNPFNLLSFAIVGDDNAPVYFSISDKGVVKVKKDLRTAPGTETQYKVRHRACVLRLNDKYIAVVAQILLMLGKFPAKPSGLRLVQVYFVTC